MAEEPKTTGTPEPDDADALEQSGTSGTPGTDGRDADAGKPTYEQLEALYLSSKEKVEEANRWKERVADLEARTQPVPAAVVQDESDELSPDEIAKLKVADAAGDWAAGAILKQDRALKRERATRMQLVRDLVDDSDLKRIPDAAKQKKVLDHLQVNRHRLGDVRAAQSEVDAEELGAENKRLREQVAALDRKRDPAVDTAPDTHGRGAPREAPKTMTEDQFDTESARVLATKGPLAQMKYAQENAARVR